MSYLSLTLVFINPIKIFQEKHQKKCKFPSRFFIFTLGFVTEIFENPFECPSGTVRLKQF
jgi:hypothetical protein